MNINEIKTKIKDNPENNFEDNPKLKSNLATFSVALESALGWLWEKNSREISSELENIFASLLWNNLNKTKNPFSDVNSLKELEKEREWEVDKAKMKVADEIRKLNAEIV